MSPQLDPAAAAKVAASREKKKGPSAAEIAKQLAELGDSGSDGSLALKTRTARSDDKDGWVWSKETYVDTPGIVVEDLFAERLREKGIDPYLQAVGNDNYKTFCPVHETGSGHEPSFVWRSGLFGRIVAYCHTGCKWDEILESLGLEQWNVSPTRVRFHYYDKQGDHQASHVRSDSVSGKREWVWELSGDRGYGRGNYDEVWLVDALARASAKGRVVWVTEGERDAWGINEAYNRGWMNHGAIFERERIDGVIAVSNPNGARNWRRNYTEAVIASEPTLIRIPIDSDLAGFTRGQSLSQELRTAVEIAGLRCRVEVVRLEGFGDAAEAIEREEADWWSAIRILDDDGASSDPYTMYAGDIAGNLHLGSTDTSGSPVLLKTKKVGRGQSEKLIEYIAMYVAPRVAAVEVDRHGEPNAWWLDWGAKGGPERVTAEEMRSKRSWELVAARRSELALTGDVDMSALAAWVRFHGRRAEQVVTWPLVGWNTLEEGDTPYEPTVPGETPEEASVAREEVLAGGRGWTHVGAEGEVAAWGSPDGSAVRRVSKRADNSPWHFGGCEWRGQPGGAGLEAEAERKAAEVVAEIATFRCPEEAGPVLAALAANAVRPWADREVGSWIRLMQVPGLSGVGKTEYLRLAGRAFGAKSSGAIPTGAALSRIGTTGTGPLLVDDPPGDTLRETAEKLRAMVTGGGRILADVEQGVDATRTQDSAAFYIYAAESSFGLNEKAMLERTIVVSFEEDARDRVDADGAPQWLAMQRLGAGPGGSPSMVTRHAGAVVRGLARVASAAERDGGIASKADGRRHLGPARWVRYGGEILARWLEAQGQPEAAGIVRDGSARWAKSSAVHADAIEKTGTGLWIVGHVLPLALRSGIRSVPGAAVGTDGVPTGIRAAVENAQMFGVGRIPPVVVFGSGLEGTEPGQPIAIGVSAKSLHEWCVSAEGRSAGIESGSRHLKSLESLAQQLAAVSVDGPQIRIAGQRVRYRLLTPEVATTLLEPLF